MSDFTLVDPKGWEYDLHSVYSAYIGYFQLNNVAWYDRSWGYLFSSFEEFLAFSWPVITVTDVWTGKPHIVTRLVSIGAFLKMIKTRFGDNISQAPNILQVTPFETTARHLRHISDYASYKKLHSTLPATVLSALKLRVRAGEAKAVKELWEKRDKTFLAIDFEWSEKNEKSCLEWGYASVRCGHLDALGHWPPNPDTNYLKGHYIIAEYVDKVVNKHCPTFPWHYAFGDSQIVPKAKVPQIIEAVISLASPDSESTPNTLVLVAHGIGGDLQRLEEMKIKLPHNVLIIDTSAFERTLHTSGYRGLMSDPRTSKPRIPGATLSLENMLRTFTTPSPSTWSSLEPGTPPSPSESNLPASTSTSIATRLLPNVTMHNAGNDAVLCLFALQMLVDPAGTKVPTAVAKKTRPQAGVGAGMGGRPHSKMMLGPSSGRGYVSPGVAPSPSMTMFSGFSAIVPSATPSPYDLSEELAALRMGTNGNEDKDAGGGVGANGSGNVRPRQTARRSRPWVGGRGR